MTPSITVMVVVTKNELSVQIPHTDDRDNVVLSCILDSSSSKLPSSPIGSPRLDSETSPVDHLSEHVSIES